MISIIVPTFEEEQYIDATLSRLAKIDPTVPFEIVVVDGGSTDDTVKKARRFANRVYKIRERGISKARNFGAMHARGKFLLFLDADVNPPPSCMNKIVEIFKDTGIAGATCRIMPTQARMIENVFFQFYNGLVRFVCKFKPHSRGEFLVVKKDKFLAVNGFDEDLPCIEDHDMAQRLSKIGKFIFVDDVTVYESMRRFRRLGLRKVVGTWFIDYLFFLVRGKPFSLSWKPIR